MRRFWRQVSPITSSILSFLIYISVHFVQGISNHLTGRYTSPWLLYLRAAGGPGR
jgi:low affinity Fe/Cu permease